MNATKLNNDVKLNEVKKFAEAELGYPVQIVRNEDVMAIIRKDDFVDTHVLPTTHVRSLDDLQDIILTLCERDSAKERHVIAKYLVEGLWAKARSMKYTRETQENKKLRIAAERAAEDRRKYEDFVKANPSILDDPEQLYGLQRSHGIIDQPTYELLLTQHRKLARMIADAQAAAKEQVIASQTSKPKAA